MSLKLMFDYQSKYLEILDDFFKSIINAEVTDFNDFTGVAKSCLFNLRRSPELFNNFSDLEINLKKLYSESGAKAFSYAKEINSCKIVLGGSSRFYKTQLNAAHRSILFSDIVMIPDPVMPYLERKREEEEYLYVDILRTIYFVLHLKELNKDEYDILPFFIFPSWEKILEDHDRETQEQSFQLISDVFSYYVDSGIKCIDDIIRYCKNFEQLFYSKVEKAKLLVAPGKSSGDTLVNSIKLYREHYRDVRTKEWCDKYLKLPDYRIVIMAISERIVPQYHLLENANELKSHPILCIESQAHYYRLICNMKNQNVYNHLNSDAQTTSIINALSSKRLDFLSNIPIDQLVLIRKSDKNVEFRKELRDLVNSLPPTAMENIDTASAEVCSYIEHLISKHREEIRTIKEKYQTKHKQTLLLGGSSLAVTLLPILGPFISGGGGFVTMNKYISEKLEEKNQLKQKAHSLMGILSLTKPEGR